MNNYVLSKPASGIDISKWQDFIDWQCVQTDFVIMRAGYNLSEDKWAFANYSQAIQLDIPVGAYWYYMGKSVNSIRNETEKFLNWLDGKYIEMPVCIDLEDKSYRTLKKADVNNWIIEAGTMLEQAGYYVCVYANKDWYDNMLDETVKSRFDIWYARYQDTGNQDHPGIKLWQYSNKGVKIGINGTVDLDRAYIDYVSLIRDKGLNNLDG